MKRFWFATATATASAALVGLVALAVPSAPPTVSAKESTTFKASLDGFHEVPPRLTSSTGSFQLIVSQDGQSMAYTLTFTALTSPTLFAHIHFGQAKVNGGIFAFLCGGGGKPDCPASGGTVSGTITAADILAPSPDQGLAAGDIAGALAIIRNKDAYANVHSQRFPAGEIRGQLRD
ncbi:MAG TPA: CHRD domain-containing protein [Chloroflexota bacterium]|jgi:hypothetical protein|nr:CHRD domain-containing protein [Chloroflexota bacterium]